MLAQQSRIIRMTGDFIAEKTVQTKRGDIMKFGTFLDADGNFFDTVHFPPSLVTSPLRGAGLYPLECTIVADFVFLTLAVTPFGKLTLNTKPDGLYLGVSVARNGVGVGFPFIH